MFSKFFGKKPKAEPVFAYAKINARAMPMTRGDLFEDPLDGALKENALGEVTGGGTLQQQTGEIEYCGVDIDMTDAEKAPPFICDFLTRHGAPRGSMLEYEVAGQKRELPFGEAEGIAIYLNGTDLPDEVYQTNDINEVIESITNLINTDSGGRGSMMDHWQGPTETALYLYGQSADKMSSAIKSLMESHPLCQKARVVRIA